MGNHGEGVGTRGTPGTPIPKTVDRSEIVWTPVESIASGVHGATLTNVQLTLGAISGKPVFVWSFTLDGGQTIDLYTSKRGEGARKGYECAKALGLSRKFTHSEAVGRRCRLVIEADGIWDSVVRVLPE